MPWSMRKPSPEPGLCAGGIADGDACAGDAAGGGAAAGAAGVVVAGAPAHARGQRPHVARRTPAHCCRGALPHAGACDLAVLYTVARTKLLEEINAHACPPPRSTSACRSIAVPKKMNTLIAERHRSACPTWLSKKVLDPSRSHWTCAGSPQP